MSEPRGVVSDFGLDVYLELGRRRNYQGLPIPQLPRRECLPFCQTGQAGVYPALQRRKFRSQQVQHLGEVAHDREPVRLHCAGAVDQHAGDAHGLGAAHICREAIADVEGALRG